MPIRLLILAFLLLVPACAGRASPPETSITLVRAENDTERTEFRYREDRAWDEVSLDDGPPRFTFTETGRTPGLITMTDPSRNGGLSLRFNLERMVVELSEGAGKPFYDRYRITAVE